MSDGIYYAPVAMFTTEDGCDVSLARDEDGNVLAWFKVEHGSIGELELSQDSKKFTVQRASVKFDAASVAALRAALIPDYSSEGVSKSDIKTALDETDHAASLGSVQTRERRLAGFLREILDYYPKRDARKSREG